MKKILFLMLITLFAKFAVASPNVTIHNTTSCTIYIMLSYSNNLNNPCLISGYSSLIPVTAGGSLYYDCAAAIAPGVSMPGGYGFYNGVRIFDGPSTCAPHFTNIGNPCLFMNQQVNYQTKDNNCQSCGTFTAVWTISMPAMDVATLTF